jgi:hypothetical protein
MRDALSVRGISGCYERHLPCGYRIRHGVPSVRWRKFTSGAVATDLLITALASARLGEPERAGFHHPASSVLAHGVRERVPDMPVGERDGAGEVHRVAQDRRRRAQRRDGQRKHAPEWRRIDRHGDQHEAAAGEDPRVEAAE